MGVLSRSTFFYASRAILAVKLPVECID